VTKPIRLIALLVLALSVLVTACSSSQATTQTIELVSPQTAAEIIDDAPNGLVVLDIRTPEEFQAARIPGAIMVDFYASDFGDRLDDLEKDVPYVLYCNSGNRSAEAAKMMQDRGFAEVYEIDGGIQAWYAAGLPLEQ
jgi:rhodanese-related sulfurtransferase